MGEYLDLNPHIYLLVTDSFFSDTGSFYLMTQYSARADKMLKALWQDKKLLWRTHKKRGALRP